MSVSFIQKKRSKLWLTSEGENDPLPLFSKKINNLLLFWKYIGIYHLFKTRVCKTQICHKTRVLLKKYTLKNFEIFFYGIRVHRTWVLGKLNFAKLEYPKNDRSLRVFKIV